MPTTAPPPPPSSGNTKYILLALLILGAAGGAWFMASQKPPPPPPPKTDDVQRVNPMAQPELELEQPKDAGTPPKQAEEPEKKPVRRGGPAVGEWDCSGDLPGAARVVLENSAQIRSCYERRLKMNNVLQGDLRLKVKIGGNGRVVASQVTGSLHDNEVFSCVRNLSQTWTFGVPSGGNCAVISVPFQFSPKP